MSWSDEQKAIENAKREWEEGPLRQMLARYGVKAAPDRFYSPLDIKDRHFLEKVGFPGQFPFTAGICPSSIGLGEFYRLGPYSGYGTPEDCRDYYRHMASIGRRDSPYLAFDLPTQVGYDSDDPMARGEVGRVGVAVDTLRDFEVIYEAFTGDADLDKIGGDWVINAPANIILAMYIALAEKRGIPLTKLRGSPQNDILKEYVSRGLYIFPPRPSMRMVRDTITYCIRHLPLFIPIWISGGHHPRHSGATPAQALAFAFSFAIAYAQLGIDAGLDVDEFLPRFYFLGFAGSIEFFKEIALHRAKRRMWAKIARDRLKAKNPASWVMHGGDRAGTGSIATTVQRPLNNLTRGVIGGVACALSGGYLGNRGGGYPYDEPLGLGHSLEAQQLTKDAGRIIEFEARLTDVVDPFAGSYFMEALTDEIEAEAWDIIGKIDAMGGAVAAIENGYIEREIAKSAYQWQREIESGERAVVGVNKFTGEEELEVTTNRLVPHPYDPERIAGAEERQIANLVKVKSERDNQRVVSTLRQVREGARDENVNLMPVILEAVKAYATLGEICGVLREVFGEYQGYGKF